MYSAWTTGAKLVWEVPRATRSYLVQEVLAPGFTPLRAELLFRFQKFFRGLLTSPSPEVVVAALLGAQDIRTPVGSNLQLLKEDAGMNAWLASPARLKTALREKGRVMVPEGEAWRITYLLKLLTSRLEAKYGGFKDKEEELTSLVNSLCIN